MQSVNGEEIRCTTRNIPVSIIRYIGPAELVAHIRIETPWTKLLHPRDISPFRQHLNITWNAPNLDDMCSKQPQSLYYQDLQAHSLVTNDSLLILIKENVLPSTDGHVIQIHSAQVPLEQLLLQGTPHKQSLLVGQTCR